MEADDGLPGELGDEAQADAALGAQSLDVAFLSGVPARPAGAMSITGWRMGYLALQTEKNPYRRLKASQAAFASHRKADTALPPSRERSL